MSSDEVLVSIGLPVRNGEHRVPAAIESILAQDYQNLELVISDNASTDGTEGVCREYARADPRVDYHRQAENIGMLNNFVATIELAHGELFSWVGDDDTVEPNYVSHCAKALAADPRLLLVTAQVSVTGPDGIPTTETYEGTGLASDDPLERFCEMLRLLNQSLAVIDPISGLVRRSKVVSIPRRNMLREDQIFATEMALAGPWGYLPEVLSHCVYDDVTRPELARRLGVPAWTAKVATARQCRELLRVVHRADLDPAQKRHARAAVMRWYGGWHRRRVVDKVRRLTGSPAW